MIVYGPQTCDCGNDTYELYVIDGDMTAACSDCGRITGSVGDGFKRGNNLGEYL